MKKLIDVLKPLKNPTETCKVCFKDYSYFSLRTLLTNTHECNKCFNIKKPKFIKFKSNNVNCLAIYEYDETLKGLIYQFKGCGDIELKDTFLESYSTLLKLMFYNYYLVCVPSFIEDNLNRGFNHVEEIFAALNLPKIDALEKTEHHKQSDQKFHDRSLIKNYLKIKNMQDLQGKRILLVDDIYTTGSTINACIDLINSAHPRCIKVLVLCKTASLEGK